MEMKELFIYHHLGLGDHLMCNGLVRELIKDEEKAVLFVKPHNLESVRFMYRDIDNLDFRAGEDKAIIKFLESGDIRSIKIGHKGLNFPGTINSYPILNEVDVVQTFYRQGYVDYEKRWDSWYVKRDLKSEHKLMYETLGLKENEKFIFVHDDSERGFNIKSVNHRSDLRIIKPERQFTSNIFDYGFMLENAEEIHCMDSSFRILCEHVNTNGKLYFHQYAKGSIGWGVPLSKKDWITFNN